MQYAFVPTRGLARARDAGFACKFDLSSAHRPNATVKSCRTSAVTRTWPPVPRLFALTEQLSALIPVVSVVFVVRSVLLAQDMQA